VKEWLSYLLLPLLVPVFFLALTARILLPFTATLLALTARGLFAFALLAFAAFGMHSALTFSAFSFFATWILFTICIH
jgi:hypothetical protein